MWTKKLFISILLASMPIFGASTLEIVRPAFSINDVFQKYDVDDFDPNSSLDAQQQSCWKCIMHRYEKVALENEVLPKIFAVFDMAKLYLTSHTYPKERAPDLQLFRGSFITKFMEEIIPITEGLTDKVYADARILMAILYLDYVQQRPETNSKINYLNNAYYYLLKASTKSKEKIIFENLYLLLSEEGFNYTPQGRNKEEQAQLCDNYAKKISNPHINLHANRLSLSGILKLPPKKRFKPMNS
jgi:hypothetical protein